MQASDATAAQERAQSVSPKSAQAKLREQAAEGFRKDKYEAPRLFDTLLADTSTSEDRMPADHAAQRQTASASLESSPQQAEVKIVLGLDDLERERVWNEARIQRRLQGDYERSSRRLASLVDESLDKPLRLHAIRVLGADTTRSGFLSTILTPFIERLSPSPLLPAAGQGKTFLQSLGLSAQKGKQPERVAQQTTLEDLLKASKELSANLQRFGIFKDVALSLEDSPSVLAQPGDVDIVVRVKEAGRFFAQTATDIGDGEGNASVTGRIRNALGGAETLEANATLGTKTRSSFQVRFETPIAASPDTRLEAVIYGAERNLGYYASSQEHSRGAQLKLRTVSRLGLHEFGYEAVARHLHSLDSNASISMRNAAGHSTKSALTHVLSRDTRDDPFVASRGYLLRLSQEYAGLGGDAAHFRAEGETQASRLVHPRLGMSAALRLGAMFPLQGRPSLFSDRFQMGGPTSVRMFKMNSMGPKDNGDYIGGDLHWSAGYSLMTPIPGKEHWPLKLHAFVNAGQLIAMDHNATLQQNVWRAVATPAVSTGLGLLYRHQIVRLELNLGVPLAASRSDGLRKGLQFGLGLSFL
ncbi:uncharacterized protein L969DRAFT_68833 [Mixia osmundae IAM 14324]|uniref:Bacterial surface antigen (D15) domain-containing protein n=1 Tax=Mixia osmundae (strain CBS 9802 / IAM 14324 / JCM 22182 / KY 12970) TaxID=764103 RepID=G7DV80_MIXOS|nr:uncharacterized protein L969DRAFT_68833 [Mixia osmundae IAM 14324]KEI42086.1 hypothetical protein L969DRAFT_68833 [Mixia osmundae IAM 14324]GAA94490.1 hypothetical protein E5Q_01142 [Mixia osmundae IAM 14324]